MSYLLAALSVLAEVSTLVLFCAMPVLVIRLAYLRNQIRHQERTGQR